MAGLVAVFQCRVSLTEMILLKPARETCRSTTRNQNVHLGCSTFPIKGTQSLTDSRDYVMYGIVQCHCFLLSWGWLGTRFPTTNGLSGIVRKMSLQLVLGQKRGKAPIEAQYTVSKNGLYYKLVCTKNDVFLICFATFW